jgi:hypothetical protein
VGFPPGGIGPIKTSPQSAYTRLYRYALVTEDWGLIVQYWNFIRDKYAGFYEFWDEEAGFFLFPEWQTAPFKPSTQMAAAFAVQEMADYVNDTATQEIAAGHLAAHAVRPR